MAAAPDARYDDAVLHASRSLRSLVRGPSPAENRIFFHNLWFRDGHNNVRYEAILPKLSALDMYLSVCSGSRLVRGLQYRAWRASERLRYRIVFRMAGRHYRYALCTDVNQIPHFPGTVVVDIDDPRFSAHEARLLSLPNVAAYVVTMEAAGRRFEQLGLDKPFHVVPQPVRLDLVDESRREKVAGELREPGDFVVGFTSAFLRVRGDRGGDNPLVNIDHLLDLWGEIHARLPQACLWLIGEPSDAVVQRCAGRADIAVLGRLEPADLVAHVANFDVALYPRTKDSGTRQSMKIAEYLSLGVPIVSYDYETTRSVREQSAGVLVDSPQAFVEAVAGLAADDERRRALGAAARAAGRALDVDHLVQRYEHEVLDRYFV
jgi:glycosyltransferase involved in cell wall biosynthesis